MGRGQAQKKNLNELKQELEIDVHKVRLSSQTGYRRCQMSWILGLYSYQNIDNKGQKWTQITSRFTVFIDKKKYSKLSVTSLFPYSLNKKSQIFSTTFSNRVFHELCKYNIISNIEKSYQILYIPRWPWTSCARGGRQASNMVSPMLKHVSNFFTGKNCID